MSNNLTLPILGIDEKRKETGRNKVTNIMTRSKEKVEDKIIKQINQVKDLVNYDIDPRKNFHLDATKVAYHKDRVEAWRKGDRVAPITIDMALTQKCSYACTFCYAGLQQNKESPMPWKIYENFLDDCVSIGHIPGEGVKAISLVSDGESTESPHYARFIRSAKERGIDIASGTNGLRLKSEDLSQIVKDLTYIRFNFDAGEPEAYAEIMGTAEKHYYQVINNIKEAVRLKKELRSDITIGLQQVLMPEYADQVIPLALLGRELGVDYTVIKHCSDDEQGSLGVDYDWYKTELAIKLLKTAEALSIPGYSVQAKWSKIMTGRDRKYSKCFGTPLMLQMSGTGIVAPCGSFFSAKYKRYHIGHIEEQRFRDIWASDRYWEVLGHLGSDNFDPRYECATLCLQDKVNEVLFDLVENNIPLPDVNGNRVPVHINFI